MLSEPPPLKPPGPAWAGLDASAGLLSAGLAAVSSGLDSAGLAGAAVGLAPPPPPHALSREASVTPANPLTETVRKRRRFTGRDAPSTASGHRPSGPKETND